MSFSFVRSRQRAHLLAALVGIVAIASSVSVGILGLLDARATEGIRLALAQRPAVDQSLLISLPLSADAERQDAAVRSLMDRDFAAVDAPIAVERFVDARVRLTRGSGGGSGRDVILASIDDLHSRVTLDDGAFPADASEVIVQADAAHELEIAPGDALQLNGRGFTVSGTWRVTDPADPRWMGDPLYLSGSRDTDAAVMLTDEAVWDDIPGGARAKWTLLPDPTEISISDLTTIPRVWSSIGRLWDGEVDGLPELRRQGEFVTTAEELTAIVDGLRAVEPVALLLLTAVASITLAAFARLLMLSRLDETTLLWARGASTADLARHVALEGAVTATLGAVVGTGAAAVTLALLDAPVPLTVALATPGLIAIVVTVSIMAVGTVRSVRQLTRVNRRMQRAPRGVVGGGAVTLLVAGAALTVWQLRLYDSPVIPTADGGRALDPVAVLAPALAVAALVLTALLALPALARVVERRAERRTFTTLLATRSLARRIASALGPALVVGLAVASLLLAAGYAATWRSGFDTSSRLLTGADVHLSTTEAFSDEQVDALTEVPSIDGVAPLIVDALSLGSERGQLLAVRPDALTLLGHDTPGADDLAAAADELRVDLPGLTLPPGTDRVSLETQLIGFDRAPTVTLLVQDAFGIVRRLPLDSPTLATPDPDGDPDDETDDVAVYEAALDTILRDAPQPSLVVAIEVLVDAGESLDPSASTSFELRQWRAGTTSERIGGAWIPLALELPYVDPPMAADGLGFLAVEGTTAVRLIPAFGGRAEDVVRPPVIVTATVAELYGFQPGTIVTFYVESGAARIDGVVAAVVPVLPNVETDIALAVDLGVLQHYQLRTNFQPVAPHDLWVGSTDVDASVAAATGIVDAGVRIDRADDPASRTVLGAAAIALWATAAACLALAVLAIAAAMREQQRSRRGDVAVLRALGFSAAQQGRMLRAEYLGWISYGVAAGLLTGVVTALLTVVPFARAAIPVAHPGLSVALTLDVGGLVAGCAALLLTASAVMLAGVRAVRRDAVRALPEVAR